MFASISIAAYDWRWVFSGIVAWLAYMLSLRVALAWLVRLASVANRPSSLLLLRVFALGSRSQRLFDALAKRWLRTGPISRSLARTS